MRNTQSSLVPITITRLGGLGDGVGEHDGCIVYVPFTSVGDEITAEIISQRKGEIRARLIEIKKPGNRQSPACQHFGLCGGCSLQHLVEEDYAALKRQSLLQIMRRLGVPPERLLPMVSVGPASRRRVEVKVAVAKGEVQLGFFGMKSHSLVDVQHCPVTQGEIVALFPSLRVLIAGLKKPGNVKAVHLTQVESGFDVMFTVLARLAPDEREKITEWARESRVLRVAEKSGEGEVQVICTLGDVITRFAGVAVELPAPAFLQATEAGQAAITDFILAETEGFVRIADFYCGCGTYSFPLQPRVHTVVAYEGSYEMVAAMQNAIRRHGLEGRMVASLRDLFANPVKQPELQSIEAAVINPPRNGAEAQVRELARSHLRKIVMVSCNPATFERDAKHLLINGYELTSLLPIDQFYWSAHLELVAAFEKALSV